MKFVVESSKLMQFLRGASKVVPQKNNTTIPILANILFEIKANELTVTAADTNIRLSTKIELVSSDLDASFTVQADIISSLIKELADQPITFIIDTDSYEINLIYSNGDYKFMGESAEAYPLSYELQSDSKSLNIDAEAFVKGIKSCKFAASTDERRPIMTSVCVDFGPEDDSNPKELPFDGVVFVATDSKILIKYSDTNVKKSGIYGKYCLSTQCCSIITDHILAKEKGEVKVSFDANYIKVETSTTEFVATLIDGKYPNYNTVIPKFNPFEVSVNKQAIQSAARRVSIFSANSGVSKLLVFYFKDSKINITANSLELSAAAEETISASINDDSMDLKIGFDYNTLTKILDNTNSEEIKITLADQTRGALIIPYNIGEGLESTALIMPMKILGE